MNMDTIYADYSISMSEFKKNPSQVLRVAGENPVAILNHSHAKATVIQTATRELTAFFKELNRTAEQLGIAERIALIAKRAYRKMLPVLNPAAGLKLLPTTG